MPILQKAVFQDTNEEMIEPTKQVGSDLFLDSNGNLFRYREEVYGIIAPIIREVIDNTSDTSIVPKVSFLQKLKNLF